MMIVIKRAKKSFNKLLILAVVIVQAGIFPLATYAVEGDTPAETSSTTETNSAEPVKEEAKAEPKAEETPVPPAPVAPTAPKPPTPEAPKDTGPKKPTGADAKNYVFNKQTGLWESQKYTWDPNTKETVNKLPQEYGFNKKSGMWETTKWVYDAPSGKYVAEVKESPVEPLGHRLQVDKELNSATDIDINNNSTVNNHLRSCSISGDAEVSRNTNGGDAGSGNAYTMANVLNMLGSSWGDLGSNVKTFTTDVNGDVRGDLYVNPNASASSSTKQNNNLDVNASENGSISNNIKLCSKSGNASVNSNTNGGNASTGNADAVVNLMNLINSSISAGDSFVGVMNINGNLDGDILLPDYLKIDNLISASTGPNSTFNNKEIENSELIANMLSTSNIDNNIDTSAVSGQADVSHNSTAGDASTGAAQTNVTLMNLTGRDIVGNNGLLVFVNVLGTWVGFIVDAPTGSTSAALGGGVNSNIQQESIKNNSANINLADTNSINNDVEVISESGDASVNSNTTAGSAKTGDASASANILNLVNSKLSLKDWFGILFINVFGSWNGSFGVDTDSGNIAALQQMANSGNVPVEQAQVFSFAPTDNNKVKLNNLTGQYTASQNDKPQFMLASAQGSNLTPFNTFTPKSSPLTTEQKKNNLINVMNFGGILTLSFLGMEQVSNFRDKAKKNRSAKLSQLSSSK